MGPKVFWLVLATMYGALTVLSWKAKKDIDTALNIDEMFLSLIHI